MYRPMDPIKPQGFPRSGGCFFPVPDDEPDPVDLATGAFSLEEIDVSLPGIAGCDFVVERVYDSGRMYDGPFGQRWDSPLFARIADQGLGTNASVFVGRMRETVFGVDQLTATATTFTTPAGHFFELLKTLANGQWTYSLTDAVGNVQIFEPTVTFMGATQWYRMREWRDRHGNRLQFVYNTQDFLTSIIDSMGRSATIGYFQGGANAGRIRGIIDATGRATSYGYDSSGNLTSITAPATAAFPNGSKNTFTYAPNSLLVSAKQAGKAEPYLVNVYDAQERVIRQQLGAVGKENVTDYTNFPTVVVTDRSGNATDYLVDPATHRILRKIVRDAQHPGTSWTSVYQYDANAMLIDHQFPSGMNYRYFFDHANPNPRAKGNLLKTEVRSSPTDPSPRVTSWTYTTDFNQVASRTSARAWAANGGSFVPVRATLYEYTSGNLTRVTFPMVTQPLTQTIAIRFEYDNLGRRTKRIDPNGRETHWTYDTQVLTPFPIRETRDATGTPVDTNYVYNAAGVLTQLTSGCACAAGTREVNFVHDERNQLLQQRIRVDAQRELLREFTYDQIGNVVTERSSNESAVGDGWTTSVRQYDLLNLLQSDVTDASTTANLTTTYAYDAEQRVTAITDANGRLQRYAWDPRDLLVSVTRVGIAADPSDDLTTSYEYDVDGRVVRITNPRGAQTVITYDGYGALSNVLFPNGNTLTYTWDLDGNLIGGLVQDPQGVTVEQGLLTYDENDRVIRRETRYVTGAGTPVGDGWLTKNYEYDVMGNLIHEFFEDGSSTTCTYDLRGNLLANRDSMTPQNGWNFEYYTDGTLKKVFEVEGIESTGQSVARLVAHYTEFDQAGRPLSIADALGVEKHYEWSIDGRLRANVDRAGRRRSYAHDELGRLIEDRRESCTGCPAETPTADIVRLFTYDRGDLASVGAPNDPFGATQLTQYFYDAFGRQSQVQHANGTAEQFGWDAAFNLTNYSDPNGSAMSLSYDLADRVTGYNVQRGVGVGGESSVAYQYDGRSRVNRAENDDFIVTRTCNSLGILDSEDLLAKDGSFHSFVRADFDDRGRLSHLFYPGHQTSNPDYSIHHWDGAGRLRSIDKQEGTTLRNVVTYAYAGRRVVAEASSARRTTRGYDGRGWLDSIVHSSPPHQLAEITLEHDATGNVVDTMRKFYDAQGVVIPPGSFDAGAHLEYDQLDQLKTSYSGLSQADLDSGNYQAASLAEAYEFDRVSNRTRRTTSRPNTTLVIDYIANVLNEYLSVGTTSNGWDPNGNLKNQGTASQFTYDHCNRPVAIQMPNTLLTFRYDPFGRRIESKSTNGAQSERLAYLDAQPISAFLSANGTSVQREYHYGQGIDDVLQVRDVGASQLLEYFTDQIGNPLVLANDAGQVIESYRYTDFGRQYLADPQTGATLPNPAPSVLSHPVAFQGRWNVAGHVSMQDFRHRLYLPDWGRFAQPDPSGFADRSLNRYQFGGNNPNYRDPFGLNKQGSLNDGPNVRSHTGEARAGGIIAGMSEDDLSEVVRADWNQDNEPNVASLGDPDNRTRHALGSEASIQEWLEYRRRVNETQCSTEVLGELLHYIQDEVYHRDADGDPFNGFSGHAWASRNCSGCQDGSASKALGKFLFGWIGKPMCPDHELPPDLAEFRNRKSICLSAAYIDAWIERCGLGGALNTYRNYVSGKPPPTTPGDESRATPGKKAGPTTPGPNGPGAPAGGAGKDKDTHRPGATTPGPAGPGAPGGAGKGNPSGGGPSTPGPQGPGAPAGNPNVPRPAGPITPGPAGPGAPGGPTPKGDTTPPGGGGGNTGPSTPGGGYGTGNGEKVMCKPRGRREA